MERNATTYFLLYLKTGGGHLAPARSIAKSIETKSNGSINPVLIDGLEKSNKFVKTIIEDGYRQSQANAVWIFELLYAFHKIKFFAFITTWLLSFFIKPYLKDRIISEKPEKIIIFHFFLIQPVLEIIEKYQLNITPLIFVTDPFTAPPIWFLRKKGKFIVFSQELKKALHKKIPEENVEVFPFVLDKKFAKPFTKKEIREKKRILGFDPDNKVTLILGGGDGIPRGKSILKKLSQKNIEGELAIVCGKNESLLTYAINLKLRRNLQNLKIFGYVDFINDLLNISDVVITKAGASTFMEILMAQKVPVINNYIWEQEKGNVDFVLKNKLGLYEKKINKLPHVINHLLTNPETYQEYQQKIKNTNLENGNEKVTEYILAN